MTRPTSDKILDAALELFSVMGYRATTTKSIAEKAGVNEVTLFRLFKTKENLFFEIIDREANLKEVFESVDIEPSEDLVKDLTDFGELMVEGMTKKSRFFKCLLMESSNRPEVWKHVSPAPFEVLDQLERFFKKARSMGTIKKGVDTKLVSVAYFSFFFRHMVTYAFLGSDPFYKMDRRTIRKFVKVLVEGLKG